MSRKQTAIQRNVLTHPYQTMAKPVAIAGA